MGPLVAICKEAVGEYAGIDRGRLNGATCVYQGGKEGWAGWEAFVEYVGTEVVRMG